ncbi:MAG: hypothetical protein ACR2M4_06940 [Actinomycetota bacterium]
MRTQSLWGKPPSRFYRLLRRLDRALGAGWELVVLGCADGKFVVPAARKGVRVYAVDCDEVALFGGRKAQPCGTTVLMEGLRRRLEREELESLVEIRHADFVAQRAPRRFTAVLTSGAIQYSRNVRYSADEIMCRIIEYVAPAGYLYVDYMLPWEAKYHGRPNCPDEEWWRWWSRRLAGWKVLYNRVLRPTRDPAHVEYPVDHYHRWGHLLMYRLP